MANAYKKAGVDVDKGYEAVKRMRRHIEKTSRPEVLGEIGSFAGLFDLTSFPHQEPVLVSGTDGVGTKLKLAFQLNQHNTVGIDLVAMCVNDIVAQGASPLFFLDYIACGINNPDVIEQLVAGIAMGCVQAGAALIGGETAEMPGMYDEGTYDLAGFAVGIAEKAKLITGKDIKVGDAIIGIASSGIHSNGYSLVRNIVAGLDLTKSYEGMSAPLWEILLTPTKIYAKPIAAIMEHIHVKGIAHITGGGFYENIPRMMPKGFGVQLFKSSWHIPPIFSFLQKRGNMSEKDMFGVFNMGIGMVLVAHEENANEIVKILHSYGETASIIGSVINDEGVYFQR